MAATTYTKHYAMQHVRFGSKNRRTLFFSANRHGFDLFTKGTVERWHATTLHCTNTCKTLAGAPNRPYAAVNYVLVGSCHRPSSRVAPASQNRGGFDRHHLSMLNILDFFSPLCTATSISVDTDASFFVFFVLVWVVYTSDNRQPNSDGVCMPHGNMRSCARRSLPPCAPARPIATAPLSTYSTAVARWPHGGGPGVQRRRMPSPTRHASRTS